MGFHKSRCKAVTQTDLTSPLHQKQGEDAAWLLREHTSMESPHCAWGAESWCVPPLHMCVHVRVCTQNSPGRAAASDLPESLQGSQTGNGPDILESQNGLGCNGP